MLLFTRFTEFHYRFSIGGYENARRNKIPQQSTVNVSFTRTRDNNSVWENRRFVSSCCLDASTCMHA